MRGEDVPRDMVIFELRYDYIVASDTYELVGGIGDVDTPKHYRTRCLGLHTRKKT